jgi:hypothetical protein
MLALVAFESFAEDDKKCDTECAISQRDSINKVKQFYRIPGDPPKLERTTRLVSRNGPQGADFFMQHFEQTNGQRVEQMQSREQSFIGSGHLADFGVPNAIDACNSRFPICLSLVAPRTYGLMRIFELMSLRRNN